MKYVIVTYYYIDKETFKEVVILEDRDRLNSQIKHSQLSNW